MKIVGKRIAAYNARTDELFLLTAIQVLKEYFGDKRIVFRESLTGKLFKSGPLECQEGLDDVAGVYYSVDLMPKNILSNNEFRPKMESAYALYLKEDREAVVLPSWSPDVSKYALERARRWVNKGEDFRQDYE